MNLATHNPQPQTPNPNPETLPDRRARHLVGQHHRLSVKIADARMLLSNLIVRPQDGAALRQRIAAMEDRQGDLLARMQELDLSDSRLENILVEQMDEESMDRFLADLDAVGAGTLVIPDERTDREEEMLRDEQRFARLAGDDDYSDRDRREFLDCENGQA